MDALFREGHSTRDEEQCNKICGGTAIQEVKRRDKIGIFYFYKLMFCIFCLFCANPREETYILLQAELLLRHNRRGRLGLHEILEAAGPLQGELQTKRALHLNIMNS